ncbi:hypothetical protein PG997_008958 [Apiospora hydei]|uniref:CFEM domain-containing protein n=1 Tax=Apiospora hydei TaxID=1337664 RepID=A0ABR1WF84_9PEZI
MRFSFLSTITLFSTAFSGGVLAANADNLSLQQIVEKMPGCAVGCYAHATADSGCSPEDFQCVCDSHLRIPLRMGACLGRDHCTEYDATGAIGDLCSRMYENPPPTEVEAASSAVSQAMATATKKSRGARTNEIALGECSGCDRGPGRDASVRSGLFYSKVAYL